MTLNINKCDLFPLKDNDLAEISGIPVNEEVTYLGIRICKNQIDRVALNFNPLIEKIRKKFDSWLLRDLSLNGRVLLSKGEGLSRLIYTAMVLDIPLTLIKQIDTKIFNFIWRNRPHYPKKKMFYVTISNGGLNTLNFSTSNTTLKVKWLKNYLQGMNKIWYTVTNLIFEKVGGIHFLLRCNFNIDRIPIKLTNFHKQVLSSWIITYKHNFSPHRCLIWNNKYIKYKNKSLYFDYWVKNGILLVLQLFNDDFTLLTYEGFLRKFGIPITPKEYAIVFDAIPSELIRLLRQGDNRYINTQYVNSDIILGGIRFTDRACTNRHIRSLCQEVSTPSATTFWRSIDDNIHWESVWLIGRKYCITNKIREVAFKIVHLIYPVKKLMLRYRNIDTDCVFCHLQEETVCHLFYECICVRLFWMDVEFYFKTLTGSAVVLDLKDIVFFYRNDVVDRERRFLLNLFILLGKYHIHKCKWLEKAPRVEQFKTDLSFYMDSLEGLHNSKAAKTLTICKNLSIFQKKNLFMLFSPVLSVLYSF